MATTRKKKRILLLSSIGGGAALIAAALYFIVLPLFSTFPAIDLAKLTPDQRKTLDSIQKIDDHPLYTMTYTGDYGQFLTLKDQYWRQLGLPEPQCSTFAALGADGGAILGHNSDSDRESYLLLFANPPGGYRSVSVVHISSAFGLGQDVRLDTEQKKALMLYAPFFTNNTGMNEMGFAYAVMAAPGSVKAPVDPALPSMTNGETQRYLLDHARDVDEAVGILTSHNVCFDKEANHWLLADASGHSAVVEWVGGKMRVLRNAEPWQVCTNFILTGAEDKTAEILNAFGAGGSISPDVNGLSYWRYATAWESLKKAGGSMDPAGAMDILKSISLTRGRDVWYDTQYSIVYDLKAKEFRIALDKQYGKALNFTLDGAKEP